MFTQLHSKLACCALLMLGAAAGLNAQWSYGAKAGAAISQHIKSDDMERASERRIGMLGGFFAEWRHETQKWGLRTELLYLEQGEKYKAFWPDSSITDIDVRQQYIVLPLLASYALGPLRLEAGPQFAYHLHRSFRNEKDDWQNGSLVPVPGFDLAANAGLRFTYKRFEIGLAYSRGLLNLNRIYEFTDANGQPIPNSKALKSYNETLQLAFGYRIIR